MIRAGWYPTLFIACVLAGCGAPPPPGGPDAAGSPCTEDDDCDVGFCGGVRVCVPGSAEADARGCVDVSAACAPGEICDAERERCVRTCDVRDADGDGAAATACGGTDCDDGDPERAPGRPEVCDAGDRDEDCDPSTFGVRDADGDSYPDAACCNGDACGSDCDDTRPTIHPTAPDTCNGVDEDCDGATDEGGALATFHPDCDGDGYGAASSSGTLGCLPTAPPASCAGAPSAGWSTNATDCDDTRAAVLPTGAEVCDGLDNDCDPSTFAVDEDDDGDGVADVACGGTDCDDACDTCMPGASAELCDGLDQDCDGMIDEGVDPSLLETFYEDEDGDGVGVTGSTMTRCVAPPGYVAVPDDCNDADARVRACAAPLHCTHGVCGCDAAVRNNSDYMDLDTGMISSVSFGGRDLMINQRSMAQMHLFTTTGVGFRRFEPEEFAAVDASYTTGGFVINMEDPVPWTSATVYVVRTPTFTAYYALGFLEAPGTGTVRFVYAPIGTPPAGFRCAM